MLSPLLEEVTGNPSLTNNKEIDLMTVDCDEQVDLAREFEVSALPTVIAFVDGQPVGKFMGAVPRSQLIEFCNELTKRYA
jgi:thioredoxin 1